MELIFDGYVISDDKAKINCDSVIEFLSRSYWANKRPHGARVIRAVRIRKRTGTYMERPIRMEGSGNR